MKRFALPLVSLAALASSAVALGNDTSFPILNVDAIETNAAVNTDISFTGAEAIELLKVLPRVSTTGGPFIEEHRRVLRVQSPGYEVVISCSDLTRVDDKLTLGTPRCRISFGRVIRDFDTIPFKAEDMCKAQ